MSVAGTPSGFQESPARPHSRAHGRLCLSLEPLRGSRSRRRALIRVPMGDSVCRWNPFGVPGVAGAPSFACPWATLSVAGTPSGFPESPARPHSRAHGRLCLSLEPLRVPGVAGAPSFACPWATLSVAGTPSGFQESPARPHSRAPERTCGHAPWRTSVRAAAPAPLSSRCLVLSAAQKTGSLEVKAEQIVAGVEVVGIKFNGPLESITTLASQEWSLQECRPLSFSAEGPAPPQKILGSICPRLDSSFE